MSDKEEKEDDKKINIKIAIAGNVDSSKSSLTSVLTFGKLDDGKGSARKLITKYKHELETGRTSHISFNHIKDGNKSVSLVDLCGHEKYFKTTLFGLTGLYIDYGMVIIEPNRGITKMTKEHIGVLVYLKIPFFVVLSKMDIVLPDKLEKCKDDLRRIFKNIKKNIVFLETEENDNIKEDYVEYTNVLYKVDKIIPAFNISCVTGLNISILKDFMFKLKKREHWDKSNVDMDNSIFYVDAAYNVQHAGLVLSGFLKGKDIQVGKELFLGPFDISRSSRSTNPSKLFVPIKIKSIHNGIRENISEISHEETGCVCIKILDKDIVIGKKQIKKGMIITQDLNKVSKNVSDTFTATVNILHHQTTIKSGYTATIHCGTIKQAAKIIINSHESKEDLVLRTGDKADITFEFMKHPEYLEIGETFFFREANVRGIGVIKKIL